MIKSFTTGITVFSAHAEVVPLLAHIKTPPVCILRARGGSSTVAAIAEKQGMYSPRTRR